MSNYEQKDNDFILSPNKYKKEDKHPAYIGTITLDGVKYRLAAWIKKGSEGISFFTGKKSEIKAEQTEQAEDPLNSPSQDQSAEPQPYPEYVKPVAEPIDDLPF